MCSHEAEYGHTVHCNATDYGPLQGNRAYSGDVGHDKVVGEGGTGTSGSVGSDGGIRRGGGGGIDEGRSRWCSGKVNHGIN